MVYRKKQRNAKKKEPVANRLKKTIESRDTVNAIKLGICVISGLLIVFGEFLSVNQGDKSYRQHEIGKGRDSGTRRR